MNFMNLNKRDNTYWSNWTTSYDSTVYRAGTIEPFTYNAEENDEGYLSLYILSDSEFNLLKSKL